MTSNYTSLLHSLSTIFSELRFEKNTRGDKDFYRNHLTKIKRFLLCHWGSIDYNSIDSYTFSNGYEQFPIQRLIKEEQFIQLLEQIENNTMMRFFKEISSFEFNIIRKFSGQTYAFMTDTYNKLQQNQYENYLQEEMLNIFFRLTQYPAGSFVPLSDLISENSTYLFYNDKSPSTLKTFQYTIEGILYTLLKMKTELPAPYYYKMAVFERKDVLNQILRELEDSFENNKKNN